MAQPGDGGFFHCVLPNGRRNTIKLIIKGKAYFPLIYISATLTS